MHNSSLTVGVALGAPLAGVVMDVWSPAWGFAAVGGVGLVVAALALPAELRRRREHAAAGTAREAADPSTAGTADPVDRRTAGAAEPADRRKAGAAVEFPAEAAATPAA